jgi:hypothetical protein
MTCCSFLHENGEKNVLVKNYTHAQAHSKAHAKAHAKAHTKAHAVIFTLHLFIKANNYAEPFKKNKWLISSREYW